MVLPYHSDSHHITQPDSVPNVNVALFNILNNLLFPEQDSKKFNFLWEIQ